MDSAILHAAMAVLAAACADEFNARGVEARAARADELGSRTSEGNDPDDYAWVMFAEGGHGWVLCVAPRDAWVPEFIVEAVLHEVRQTLPRKEWVQGYLAARRSNAIGLFRRRPEVA